MKSEGYIVSKSTSGNAYKNNLNLEKRIRDILILTVSLFSSLKINLD